MKDRVEEIISFFDDYKKAINAATGAKYDQNANVVTKNIATMQAESIKKLGIDVQRKVAYNYVEKYYGHDLAEQYVKDLERHIIYTNDESTLGGYPYCCSISLYPFLLNGLRDLGGSSGAPKHANGFIGGLINLIFLVAGQFAGAVAVPETLVYFDHFLRLDFGQNYIQHIDDNGSELRHRIEDWFQQLVYSINQPAGSRNYQSPFTNISYYDQYYFKSLFEGFVFPDGDEPCWETTKELQKIFMKWFNKERTREVLTFPVETMNLLWDKETKQYKDKEMADFTAEMWSEGHSFFLYNSDSVDALSSCCRLRSSIEDNVFSYTLGAGGIETGSKRVITLNLNRIVQDWYRSAKDRTTLKEFLIPIIERLHKYLIAWNYKLWDDYNTGMLTVYKAGFIDLDKQYLTVGFNGFVEAAEFLGMQNDTAYNGVEVHSDSVQYKQLAKDILSTIKELNKRDRTEHCKFNTEMIPAESVGPKHYKWDKEDGYWVPEGRNCYNSYFYPVEDPTYDPIEKMRLQGEDFIGCLDGGSALHCNLDSHLSEKQYRFLMDVAVKTGCSYFTFNIPNTICNKCGHIDKRMLASCPICGSTDVDYATRIIGYLRRISNFSLARQIEAKRRFYGHPVFSVRLDQSLVSVPPSQAVQENLSIKNLKFAEKDAVK